MKNTIKAFLTIFLIGMIENIAMLTIFGVPVFNKTNMIILAISTIALTLILNRMDIING